MATNFKRGDIVAKLVAPGTELFAHVERVNADGTVDAIGDETGLPVGLNAHKDTLRAVTPEELVEVRNRRRGRPG